MQHHKLSQAQPAVINYPVNVGSERGSQWNLYYALTG